MSGSGVRIGPVGGPAVLVVASTYPRWRGDPEPAFVHELCRRLADRFRVLVVCPHAVGAAKREIMDGVEVVRYRYAPEKLQSLVNNGGILANLRRARWKWLLVPVFLLSQMWCCWRLLHSERISVIHAHWLVPQGLVATLALALARSRVPLVVTAHGSDVNAVGGSVIGCMKRQVVRAAAVVTTVSEPLRVRLQAKAPEADIRVAPMGVDLSEHFTPSDNPPNACEILVVGRLVPGKGVDHVIDALPVVRERLPAVSLTIVGQGPEESALRAQVARLGLSDCVQFTGAVAQERLPAFYRRAGVFVAAFGEEEGLGLVLVEAIGCGCPVVANDTPAARYILGEEAAALTVDCGDPVALANRIVRTLLDPNLGRRSASTLRSRICCRFDWQRVARGYAELLGEVVSRGPE